MNKIVSLLLINLFVSSSVSAGVYNPIETYNNINESYANNYITFNEHLIMQFQSIIYPSLLTDSLVDSTASENDFFELQDLLHDAMEDFNIADTFGQRLVYNLFQEDIKDSTDFCARTLISISSGSPSLTDPICCMDSISNDP